MNHDPCIEALNDLIKLTMTGLNAMTKATVELQDGENGDLKSLFQT